MLPWNTTYSIIYKLNCLIALSFDDLHQLLHCLLIDFLCFWFDFFELLEDISRANSGMLIESYLRWDSWWSLIGFVCLFFKKHIWGFTISKINIFYHSFLDFRTWQSEFIHHRKSTTQVNLSINHQIPWFSWWSSLFDWILYVLTAFCCVLDSRSVKVSIKNNLTWYEFDFQQIFDIFLELVSKSVWRTWFVNNLCCK
jgi:hypothetical protein